MIGKLKTLFLTAVASTMFLVPVAAPVTAYAADVNIEGNLCNGVDVDVNPNAAQDCSDSGAEDTVSNILKLVINLFSIIVGVIAVIMIIVGGVKYITSGGESGKVTEAKNTILFAIIGLIVVALAQIIVRFVLSKVSGAQ